MTFNKLDTSFQAALEIQNKHNNSFSGLGNQGSWLSYLT